MKLLTLNTHSLEEKDMEEKLQLFADFVAGVQPDVIALQEVNQTMTAPLVPQDPAGLVKAQTAVPMRADNYALALNELLRQKGVDYHWTWLPIKTGYSKYDEGLAVFSKQPILDTANLLVSGVDDYTNFQTRRLLGIRTENGWFFDVHMSWWGDPDEPFAAQWNTLMNLLPEDGPIYLMGDFNGDAQIRGENYDLVASDGWFDTYELAVEKDDGWTMFGMIDGWRDQKAVPFRRIDQIWVSEEIPVKTSRIHFNGKNEPIVSDHFALYCETV